MRTGANVTNHKSWRASTLYGRGHWQNQRSYIPPVENHVHKSLALQAQYVLMASYAHPAHPPRSMATRSTPVADPHAH